MTITAQVIADSINDQGTRITTLEIETPRIIWSEFLTHRMLSKNASSSRAIPVKKMLDLVRKEAARPFHWGKNQPGMQAFEEQTTLINGYTADEWWDLAANSVANFAEAFEEAKYHKQVVNRLLEPFSHIKAVVTATSYDNFFKLRIHEMADPTIHMLAVTMFQAMKENTPRVLVPGEWHTPYYQDGYWSDTGNGKDVHGCTLQEALMISASCCAQVSYRKLDDSFEKAVDVFTKLNLTDDNEDPRHSSPAEHQATPMEHPIWDNELFQKSCEGEYTWENGVTHLDRENNFHSGNFMHWIQHRQLIPGHDCKHYQP
jgi:thymidylate synthase ThyX